MVEINNNLRGTNAPVIDAYLRNLNEYRANVENAILPLISYFVDMTESQITTVRLPSSIFEDQKDYLIRIAKRYHKREFDVVVNPSEPLEVYNLITQLIRTNKKAVQYSLCDCIDFMFLHPHLFEDVTLNYNLAKAVQEETVEYNHKHSQKLNKIIEEAEINFKKKQQKKQREITYPSFTKFASPQHVYLFMLDNMKRAADFEILKLYDFLREYEPLVIHSNKLKEIEENLKRRGEGEYTKKPFKTKILHHEKRTVRTLEDIFIDQWSANIRRSIEAQTPMAHNFVNYIKTQEGKKAHKLYTLGTYPDLISLLHHHFKGDIPKHLKIDF